MDRDYKSWFKVFFCLALCCLCSSRYADGQTGTRSGQTTATGQFINRIYRDAEGDHKYVVFVPAGYTPTKKWPTVLYLHGAHCRGQDGRAQLVSGLAPAIKRRVNDYPFLVVFPQCENTHSLLLEGWSDEYDDADRALKILDTVEQDYSVDKSREILMGSSMGGTGVWEMAARTPERWSALVPSAGYGNPALAAQVATIPIWSFHVTNDKLTPVSVARDMVTVVRAAGGRAFLSEVDGKRHADCNLSFLQPALHQWLLDPRQDPQIDHLVWKWPAGFNEGFEDEVAFVPGAELSGAVQMRVCPDVLESLSYALPRHIASQLMAGTAPNKRESKRIGLMPFDISMSGIQYKGQLERAQIIPLDGDLLQIQLGLRHVTMTIANSQIESGWLFSASAGCMHIVMGHRVPVWLNVRVRPRVENRQLRIELVRVDFQIPANNWYVTEPAGVHVRGMPFLNRHVSDGLVKGVYESKSDIEQQVRSSVQSMLPEIEATLNQQFQSTLKVNELAIPVWHPRVKIWPEHLSIDRRGMHIVLGATFAKLGNTPADFRVRTYPSKLTDRFDALESGVEVAVSEHFIPAYTELMIAGGVNDLHAADFRLPEFDALNNRDFLEQMIPDLKQLGNDTEATVSFQLLEPVRFQDLDLPITPAVGAKIVFPKLRTLVSTRHVGEKKWKPYVEVHHIISRDYEMSVGHRGYSARLIRLKEVSQLRVSTTARFADGYVPQQPEIHLDPLIAQLDKALVAACGKNVTMSIPAKDFDLIGVPLRLEKLDRSEGLLFVQQQIPGIVVTNSTTTPMTYQVRAPFTPWGPVQPIAPGERLEHSTLYPLLWQCQHSGKTQLHTLPMGREASFHDQPTPELVLLTDDPTPEEADQMGIMLKFLGY